MANPLLVRAGLKVAKKVGKKAIKKIKQRRNSTDNLTQGPLDTKLRGISRRNTGGDGYKVPDTFSRPKAGSKGTLRETAAEKAARKKASDKELGLIRGKGKRVEQGEYNRQSTTYAKPQPGGMQMKPGSMRVTPTSTPKSSRQTLKKLFGVKS